MPDNFQALQNLLSQFLESPALSVTSSQNQAIRMAGKAQLIRDIIQKTFDNENIQGTLQGQMESFRKVFLRDMTPAAK